MFLYSHYQMVVIILSFPSNELIMALSSYWNISLIAYDFLRLTMGVKKTYASNLSDFYQMRFSINLKKKVWRVMIISIPIFLEWSF